MRSGEILVRYETVTRATLAIPEGDTLDLAY